MEIQNESNNEKLQIVLATPNGEYTLDVNEFLRMDAKGDPEITYCKAQTCFELNKYEDALLYSNQAFQSLISMGKVDDDFSINYQQELLTRCTVIQGCSFMNLNDPHKAMETTLQNLGSINNIYSNFPNKLVLLVSLVDYSTTLISKYSLNDDIKAHFKNMINDFVFNIEQGSINNKLSSDCLRIVCGNFFRNMIRNADDNAEKKFNLITGIKVINECSKKLSKGDEFQSYLSNFLEKLTFQLKIELARVSNDEYTLEKSLFDAMKKDDVFVVGELMVVLSTVYKSNDRWYKVIDTFDEPYFYLMDKINETKDGDDNLAILVEQFSIVTLTMADYQRVNADNCQMALRYMMSLDKFLESEKVSKALNIDFKNLGDEDVFKAAYKDNKNFLTEYVKAYMRIIKDFSCKKMRVPINIEKFQKVYNAFIKLNKEEDIMSYLFLRLSEVDVNIYLKKKGVVNVVLREVSRLLKDEISKEATLEPDKQEELKKLKLKFLAVKLSYYTQFSNFDMVSDSVKIDMLFDKIYHKPLDKYPDIEMYILGLYIPVLIMRGSYKQALGFAIKYSKLIKNIKATNDRINLVALRYKKEIYRGLQLKNEYNSVCRKIKKLKKLLDD